MKLRYLSRFLPVIAIVLALGHGPAQAQGRGGPGRDMPYATSFGITINSGVGGTVFSPDAVPANKRLVIEFVTVVVNAQPGDKPSLFLSDSVNGVARAYWIPLTLDPAAGGAEMYRASHLVKLNHDGNGTGGPGFQCSRSVNSFAPMNCFVTLSGYLIDK